MRYYFGMPKKLFLLDGMALVYRAHFAFVSRPILTSKGVNTSALYGFTQTLLDILNSQQPIYRFRPLGLVVRVFGPRRVSTPEERRS